MPTQPAAISATCGKTPNTKMDIARISQRKAAPIRMESRRINKITNIKKTTARNAVKY